MRKYVVISVANEIHVTWYSCVLPPHFYIGVDAYCDSQSVSRCAGKRWKTPTS